MGETRIKKKNFKWYNGPIFTAILLLLFFPVGLFMMWKNKHYNLGIRILITFIILIFIPFVIGWIHISNTENIQDEILEQAYTNKNKENKETEDLVASNVDWNIYEVKDFHIVNAKRFSYKVVVEPGVSVEDLKLVSKEVIELAKKETPFNAVTVYFYDSPAFIESGEPATLGLVNFGPNGEWGDAREVNTSEYDKMRSSYDLKEKDWSKRPTDEEIKISTVTSKTLFEYSAPIGADFDEMIAYEEAVFKTVAEHYGKSVEEIQSIHDKTNSWILNDLSNL